MLNQVTRAIEPHLPLTAAITAWNAISEELADPPRLRLGQLESYFDYSKTSYRLWALPPAGLAGRSSRRLDRVGGGRVDPGANRREPGRRRGCRSLTTAK